ncbi:immune inhibitor A domain-containing protein [Paenactinomyces guangxiensis]|uniref:Immune inhibitor A n=1 Tax=Paenactinomyces guangxiensis TaxID=1490290 RepID=A0A7W1WQ33_9BACL|nr:immune inhibitor A domain-containing protein [Paenactinomyces guangxiensis]MBA4493990.1 immune inhibitor A [Paenactinomyces guangxiensis]MBH8593411.1 immune inhibitor A [Paenactinomyces guangxiensis]
MKIRKTMVGVLSASLVLGAFAGAPLASAQPTSHDKHEKHVDWATVDFNRLSKALIQRGVIDKNASEKEVRNAVEEYAVKNSVEGGIDTSTSFGKKAEKGLKSVRQRGAKKASGKSADAKLAKAHKDNIVMALVEFPDYNHNRIQPEEGNLYTKDFNPEHYRKMLFNQNGYTTPEGVSLTTMAQYYYQQSGGTWTVDGVVTPWIQSKRTAAENDQDPRGLVAETLSQVGEAIKGKEALYDQRDPYDIDGDGQVMEPDGLLDNLMLVHAGVGEEAGGGDLGADAIWSHRWTLRTPTAIPGTTLKAYDYMIQPEDGAVGVFAHEYGHNLGLPDLYDTTGEGFGSPVGTWSIMSGGSWNGKIAGAEPTGFDPWSKMYLQATFGGKWISPVEINHQDIRSGQVYKVNEAVSFKPQNKVLKVNLPDVEKQPPTQPAEGKFAYFSDLGDNVNTKMTSPEIDLTGVTKASLSFDSWRDIETGYDYLYVNIIDAATNEKTTIKSYDDVTGGWVKEELDLSSFANKKIKVEFNYVTDAGWVQEGFYVDNISVTADENQVFADDGEGTPKFDLSGFIHFDGKGKMYPSYYLIEWRTHNGMDQGLANLRRGSSFITSDPGMVVWYYDGRYLDNNTSLHPGEGMIGVVDAHQRIHYWNTGEPATDRYQLVDAAFSFNPTSEIHIDNYATFGSMHYPSLPGVSTFYDGNDYSLKGVDTVGKILPKYGLQFKLKKVRKDGTSAHIELSKR